MVKSFLKFMWYLISGKSFRAVVFYRISNWTYKNKLKIFSHLFWMLNLNLHSIEISPTAELGKRLKIPHTVGIVVGAGVRAGEGLTIYQNVTLGSKKNKLNIAEYPIIGNNVTLYPGSVIVGGVKIGDNSIIGPNSVVIKDIPANVTAVGVPAKFKI